MLWVMVGGVEAGLLAPFKVAGERYPSGWPVFKQVYLNDGEASVDVRL